MNAFSDNELRVLSIIHVGMPWKFIQKYLDSLLNRGMSIEIGIGVEELDNLSRRDFLFVAQTLRERGVSLIRSMVLSGICVRVA